jgi:pyruvate/2-oxoglutarate dehydrogenase complex dihydrolipoamide acyltransferase (E2) component
MTPETRVEVVMPQLGISVTEGTIVQWRKRPGDAVAYEEPICDIDTDKIESELPAPVSSSKSSLRSARPSTPARRSP